MLANDPRSPWNKEGLERENRICVEYYNLGMANKLYKSQARHGRFSKAIDRLLYIHTQRLIYNFDKSGFYYLGEYNKKIKTNF